MDEIGQWGGELAAAFAEAQSDMEAPLRNKTAEIEGETKEGRKYKYKYYYAPFEEVVRVIKEPFKKAGLSWRQDIIAGAHAGVWLVRTHIIHKSGESFSSDYPLVVTKSGAQGFAAASTFARRYGLAFAAGLAAEDDDDANANEGTGATVSEKPRVERTGPAGSPANNGKDSSPTWMDEFLKRSSYEINPKRIGWPAWEKHYLQVSAYVNTWEHLHRLKQDNNKHIVEFRTRATPDESVRFTAAVEAAERRVAREPVPAK